MPTYVNHVIARKHPAPQWLTADAAVNHCTEGIGIWQWASNGQYVAPGGARPFGPLEERS